jgi:hypothetical protein
MLKYVILTSVVIGAMDMFFKIALLPGQATNLVIRIENIRWK